jgi:hypothetical protein
MIVLFGVLFLFVIPAVVYLLRRDIRRRLSTPGASVPLHPRKSTTVTYQR